MPLTAKQVESAKPKNKLRSLSDSHGLILQVPVKGAKRWRYRYYFEKKEQMLSLGTYPQVTLKEARKLRDAFKVQIDNGINPSVLRKKQKQGNTEKNANTFYAITQSWIQKHLAIRSAKHRQTTLSRLKRDVLPFLGNIPIEDINTQDMLGVINRIENRGAMETARRVRALCAQIFRYAVALEKTDKNPADNVREFLAPLPTLTKHHAALTAPKDVSQLMKAIHAFEGHFVTACALKITAYTFLRSSEVRFATWDEIDLENKEWRIPASRMKSKQMHIVPLSKQALEALADLQPLTQHCDYIFPSVRTDSRPLSENTINAALRRMGFTKEQMTCHGFRGMASTILNENDWRRDYIERQLAHIERNKVRAAYNHAEYLPQRRKMMQWYATYLDQLSKE